MNFLGVLFLEWWSSTKATFCGGQRCCGAVRQRAFLHAAMTAETVVKRNVLCRQENKFVRTTELFSW